MYSDPFFVHTNKILKLLQANGHLISRTKTQSTALHGGYWNVVMRVQAPKIDLVVKQSNPDVINPMFPNLPDDEALAFKTLSPYGICPSFVDYVPDADGGPVLVYQFCDGEKWQHDCSAVGRLLRKLHDLDVSEDFRALNIEPAGILAQAREALEGVPVDTPNRILLEKIRPEPIAHPGLNHLSLIHTDCGPGNLIQNGDNLFLIDWQCPGMGDPVEDLVCFSSPGMQILYDCAPLSEGEVADLLNSYSDPDIIDRFHKLRVFYHYRFLSYYVLRSHTLREAQPGVADRYDQAFNAEIKLLETF